MHRPLFSIIAPTMGRLELWRLALASAVSQQFSDYEIIAINSQPSQESKALIEALNNPRLTYIECPPDEARFNWDTGFRRAEGRYILWLDDDNYLLPHALTKLTEAIRAHNPDIASGDHIHWRDAQHPDKDLRNQLVVPLPLFSHAISLVDGKNYIRKLFGMPAKAPVSRARFHFSETAFRRELIERSLNNIGRIDFSGTSPRLLQLGLLASAESVSYLDSPICIVIQMGDSLAYQWSKKKDRAEQKMRFQESPVSGNVYINYATENLLKAKRIFSKELSEFDLNLPLFLKTYARELVLLEQSWPQFLHTWKEYHQTALRHLGKQAVWQEILRTVIAAIAIKVLKDLRLYRIVKNAFGGRKQSLKHNRIISLNDYRVQTIQECAIKLPEIVKNELNIEYRAFLDN